MNLLQLLLTLNNFIHCATVLMFSLLPLNKKNARWDVIFLVTHLRKCSNPIETSNLTCKPNHLTAFNLMQALNGLKKVFILIYFSKKREKCYFKLKKTQWDTFVYTVYTKKNIDVSKVNFIIRSSTNLGILTSIFHEIIRKPMVFCRFQGNPNLIDSFKLSDY